MSDELVFYDFAWKLAHSQEGGIESVMRMSSGKNFDKGNKWKFFSALNEFLKNVGGWKSAIWQQFRAEFCR